LGRKQKPQLGLPVPLFLQDFLRSGCDLEVSLKDLRILLPTLSADAAAIAGQAVALSQWHQVGGSSSSSSSSSAECTSH
jgi:hypothetical protein